ncbi:MAG: Gfo/Idh/MocA family oxidoreductase [Planctomycetaceae bacterium]|nr:Gfo/Idh/MocA family oxidoreductase [Planctomycetaceae bacterium]
MNKKNISRRIFLQGTGLAFAAPMVVPSSVFGDDQKAAPSERVTVGHIGVGNQGRHLHRSVTPVKDAQTVAISDCYKSRRAGLAKASNAKEYADFRELLAQDNIDCVIIATPDHWHVPIAIAAAKSKKSAYVEKPLGLTIAQDILCEKVFKENGVQFQYGTQQRSQDNCWRGCQLVKQGAIGKIKTIEVDAPNGSGGMSKAEAPIPDDLGKDGFEMWTGPSPVRPYSVGRCSPPGTYFIYDFSIGYLGGWGAHPLDIMVWGSDADLSGQITVEGTGVIEDTTLYDAIHTWNTKIKLGEVDLIFKHGGDRTRFIGEDGKWIEVRRGGTKASDPELLKLPIKEEGQLKISRNHYNDFILGVKNKTAPVSTLRDAVRSDIISHLCDIAIRTKSKVKWDPIKFALVDPTPEQQKMLDRPLREPWTL